MKAKAMVRLAAACALVCASLAVASASASAAGAIHLSPAGVQIDLGPIPAGQPGVSVVGNCPMSYYSDDMQLLFANGNAVMYRDGNGANLEGEATLFDNTTGLATSYSGHAHVWFGQNTNPNNSGLPGVGNQQQWFAQTVSFNGSATDGTSVTISTSFGGGTSASGHMSGWTHVKVTCK